MEIELVRQVQPALRQKLVEMERDAFGEGGLNIWQLMPFIRHGRVFVARESGVLTGVLQYMLDWDNPLTAYLVGVSVVREARGKGLGTEFIRKTLQVLADEGLSAVELTVHPENAAAIRVYEHKLGFVPAGMRTDEYGPGEHRLVLRVSLVSTD